MNSWHAYPQIFALGHKAIQDLLKQPVLVEEKVDGSQFSWCLGEDGELHIRSKGAVMHPDAPEKMFSFAAETVKRLQPQLHVGWTYRAEYLRTPKHNALVYDRIPAQHVILFDINPGLEEYLPYDAKVAEAQRLGLEVVPRLYEGHIPDIATFRQFLETTSILGGQKVEGVVVKPATYNLFGLDKKVLMGKFVSEAFKEVHAQAWRESNPTVRDIVTALGESYTSLARWQKAAQHLAERGELEWSPRDIGKLIKEVPEDILKEEEEAIKAKLFAKAWPDIRRMVVRGLPEWWKEELLRRQFEQEPA